MTDAQTKAYRAWQKAANPSDATMRRESNIADFERRNARVRKLKAAYEASIGVHTATVADTLAGR
jgi:hypothetical protein